MLSYEYVKNVVEKEDYTLISNEYMGCYHKLKMVCKKDHTFEMKWYKFQTGHRCPLCAGNIKHSITNVKKQIEKEKYTLLSTDYKNNKTKLEIQCPSGHTFHMRYDDWVNGHRCRKCYEEKIKYSVDEIKEILSKERYTLLSTNVNGINDKIKIKCDKGHIYKGTLHNFLNFNRCPICSKHLHQSKGEKEVVEFIHQIYNGVIIENDRKTIQNPITKYMLELDILLPDINKAIEYNSEYWHRDYKDNIKINECINHNIDLMIINHNDWKHIKTRNICKEKIKSFLQV